MARLREEYNKTLKKELAKVRFNKLNGSTNFKKIVINVGAGAAISEAEARRCGFSNSNIRSEAYC